MTCNNWLCCHYPRSVCVRTAPGNVNMVAYGKINSRLSPVNAQRMRPHMPGARWQGGPFKRGTTVYGKHITHARSHARICTLACTHTHTLAHTPTHLRRRPGCRCSMGWCAPNHDEDNAPLSPVPLATNGRSVLHSNKQSRMRRGIRDSFGCFSRIKNSRPN